MKRTLSLSLAALTLLGTVSCGGGSGTSETTTAPSETTAAETTESVESLLGFAKEDNGGKTFTMLVAESKNFDYNAEETNGDVVNDAVYEKNSSVEDYLGINFEFLYEDGGWNARETFNNLIKSDVMAGGGEYDLVSAVTVCSISASMDGVLLDGKSLPNVQFDKPWWLADMYNRFSVEGKLYGFLGDASLSLYKDMTVVYFNKRIWDEFKAPDPYELVRNNEWTLDKFIELGSGMSLDLNGDGVYDETNDQLTFVGEGVPCGTFQTALELKVVNVKDGAAPEYIGLTERYITAYEKLAAFMKGEGNMRMSSIDDKSYKSMLTFANGNVATMVNFIYSTEYLRDMKDDYGIVPMPKFDEKQEQYTTQLGTSTAMLCVPATTKDVTLTSKVMEALAYYTSELVVPKYYEVALKEKYARDADMAEMLDIIRAGATFDFVFMYGSGCLKQTPNAHFRFTGNFQTNLSSTFASLEAEFTASVEKLAETYASLEN